MGGLLDVVGVYDQEQRDAMVSNLLPEVFSSVLPKYQARNSLQAQPWLCHLKHAECFSKLDHQDKCVAYLHVVTHLCTIQQQ